MHVRALALGIALALGGVLTFALPVAPVRTLVAAEEPLDLPDGPTAVAVHGRTGRLYISNSLAGTVSVVEGQQTVAVIATGRSPHAIVVDEERGRVYVSDFEDGTVTAIDAETNSVVATLRVGGLGLAIDRGAARLYAAAGDTLAIIDTRTDRLLEVVPSPKGASLWGLAVDESSGLVYASDVFLPRVFVLDGTTGSTVRTIKTSAPVRFALALDPTARLLYTASDLPEGAVLESISTDTGVAVARSGVAGYPYALAIDVARGSLYLGDLNAGTLTAYGLPLGGRSEILQLDSSPRGLAVHPASGRVYLVAFSDPEGSGDPPVAHPVGGRLHTIQPLRPLPLDGVIPIASPTPLESASPAPLPIGSASPSESPSPTSTATDPPSPVPPTPTQSVSPTPAAGGNP